LKLRPECEVALGKKDKNGAKVFHEYFEGTGCTESKNCVIRAPSKKRDRVLKAKFFHGYDDFGGSVDGLSSTSESVNTINLLPICYLGNKKRMLVNIWDFLDENQVEFKSSFDAFSGSCVFSFFCLLSGRDVIANDIMAYPSFLAKSLLDPASICPSDEELNLIMGLEINPSNNNHWASRKYRNLFFTDSECEFLDRYRSNVISLYGPVALRGMNKEGEPSLIGLDGSGAPKSTEGMMKASFSLYLILTLLHQLCFTGGRFFRRQIIAKVDYRLDHVRNKGEELHANPRDFMWLTEIRKFISVIKNSNRKVDIYSEDIISLLSSGKVKADMIYLDPPYGGLSSDYGTLYKIFEEYIWGVETSLIPYLVGGANRFKKPKGYKEQLEETLEMCKDFPVWLLSYNCKSFSSKEEIVGLIKRFRKDVVLSSSDIKYRYRKGTGDESEILILAR
jgi:adenine-specific DNA-methyltransferase